MRKKLKRKNIGMRSLPYEERVRIAKTYNLKKYM